MYRVTHVHSAPCGPAVLRNTQTRHAFSEESPQPFFESSRCTQGKQVTRSTVEILGDGQALQCSWKQKTISFFPCCCNKISQQKHLRKDGVYCGSCPMVHSIVPWKGWWWQESRVVTWYPVRREMTAGAQLTFSFLLPSQQNLDNPLQAGSETNIDNLLGGSRAYHVHIPC